ncbi:MAG: hypothetical protein JWQ04_2306, partial [Pedosphaera sp.]|nr:hypothetical protein [Pedosphaera sp.]
MIHRSTGGGTSPTLSSRERAGLSEFPNSMFGVRCWMFDVSRFMERAGAPLILLFAFLLSQTTVRASAANITHITATPTQISITGHADDSVPIHIAELAPYQSTNDLANAPEVAQARPRHNFSVIVPRWDGPRDRLYSGFLAFTATNGARLPQGEIHFVEEMPKVSKYREPFPRAASKKGLQVQMVDDALALGVKHAALNLNLTRLIDLNDDTNRPDWQMDGVTYHFRPDQVDALDH